MNTVNLANAKAHLSELLDGLDSGGPFVITRHDRPVAQVSAVVAPKRALRSLAEFRAGLPGWHGASADRLRALRDAQR